MKFEKSILWFTKDEEGIIANSLFFNNRSLFFIKNLDSDKIKMYNKHFNTELDAFTYAFENSLWECYWTCIDFIDFEQKTIKIYNRKKNEYKVLLINELDSIAKFSIFKYLGSVEGQRDKVYKTIEVLESEYKGILINHPKTMKYFIDKTYLKDMEDRGFPFLMKNTFIFKNDVSYETLVNTAESCGDKNNFIIKPLTGELANSFSLLSEADEKYLRRKQDKLGGWILQPINPHIWNGEHRLIFFGNMCTLGVKKIYLRHSEDQRVPNEKERSFINYLPTKKELGWANKLKKMWEESMQQKIYYFRLDFVKDDSDNLYMLEFEALNPGFGFKAIPDKVRLRIANEFVSFLNFYPFHEVSQ